MASLGTLARASLGVYAGFKVAEGRNGLQAANLAVATASNLELHEMKTNQRIGLEQNQLMLEGQTLMLEGLHGVSRELALVHENMRSGFNAVYSSIEDANRLLEESNTLSRQTINIMTDQLTVMQEQSDTLADIRHSLVKKNEVEAEEILDQGERIIASLAHSEPGKQRELLKQAIEFFDKAIALDPFTEQAHMLKAFWMWWLDPDSDGWVAGFEDTWRIALTETQSKHAGQRQLAEATMPVLAYLTAGTLSLSGRWQEFLAKFRDKCRAKASDRFEPIIMGIELKAILLTEGFSPAGQELIDAMIGRFGIRYCVEVIAGDTRCMNSEAAKAAVDYLDSQLAKNEQAMFAVFAEV
jgi:hypothetical protein